MYNVPNANLLQHQKYFRVHHTLQFLNRENTSSWTRNNPHAILVNCIEVYGRKKHVYVHCEPFQVSKGIATKTSTPGSHEHRYVDVYPTTMHSNDGERLVIGTHTMNALVTSSIRIDQKEKPSVGGKTLSFLVEDERSSFNTRIYLDQESIDRAMEIASDKDVWYSERENKVEQIRQIRSKFVKLQSYLLCRAWGPLTPSHLMQPYSIFTLRISSKWSGPDANLEQIISCAQDSQFMAWFKLNSDFEKEISRAEVANAADADTASNIKPKEHERYCLRLLLMHVKGSKDFAELRTVPEVNQAFDTFYSAALARGFLEDDE
ncbi:hypothetical protein BX616_002311 [Lobosporangium transversale]|nr:hypothetical protein BX616_002311 [Lobosporangium transversale]